MESIKRYDDTDETQRTVSAKDAYYIAYQALHSSGRPTFIWDEPTHMIGDNYFFTEQVKFGFALRGVLVSASDGSTVFVDTDPAAY